MFYAIFPDRIQSFYYNSGVYNGDVYYFDATSQFNTYKCIISYGIAKLYINGNLVLEQAGGTGIYSSNGVNGVDFGSSSSGATCEGYFDEVRAYQVPSDNCDCPSCPDEGYDDGRQAGMDYCKNYPEQCGIIVDDRYDEGYQAGLSNCPPPDPSGGCTQSQLDDKYNEGHADGIADCPNNPAPSDGCAILEGNFNITMPCIDVFGTRLPIDLEKFIYPDDPFGYYWKLNLQ